jgi:hypothetical protein
MFSPCSDPSHQSAKGLEQAAQNGETPMAACLASWFVLMTHL